MTKLNKNKAWNDTESYLQWLYKAYEQFKAARFVYDKKGTHIFYNKPYWSRRFKVEIERAELRKALEERLMEECKSESRDKKICNENIVFLLC
ncbi:MAG: hypothetical protein ACLQQ4_15895 [Bacteroidia bacterium]